MAIDLLNIGIKRDDDGDLIPVTSEELHPDEFNNVVNAVNALIGVVNNYPMKWAAGVNGEYTWTINEYGAVQHYQAAAGSTPTSRALAEPGTDATQWVKLGLYTNVDTVALLVDAIDNPPPAPPDPPPFDAVDLLEAELSS